MLIVKDSNGNQEALTNIQGAEINEEVNGDHSISFTAILDDINQHSFPLINFENKVELDGHEYRIKQMTKLRNRKSVTALNTYFDLINHRKEELFGGTRTGYEVFAHLFAGTGWSFEITDKLATTSFLLPNFGIGNVVALVNQACGIMGAKRRIMPNKHVRIGFRVGEDKDEQFRYKHNIKSFKENYDTNGLVTAIKGYGANGLEVTYYSPIADKYDQIHWGDDVHDDRFTIPESLLERIKQEIKDLPNISIDIETAALGFDVDLDDGIWTIYEPMDLEYISQVAAIKSYPFANKSPVVTMASVQKTFTDNLTDARVEIDENKKETRSKFEQVNDRITMEVEEVEGSIARLELKADNIELSVNNRITNEVAAINIRADNILAEVSRVRSDTEEDIARLEIRADNIAMSVSSTNERIGSAEARIDIQATQISNKVSQTDFNGNTIKSLINQTAGQVLIEANNIDLRGVVTTNDIQVGNSIRLGNDDWTTNKQLIFNNSTYLTGNGGRLEFVATNGGLNFMSYSSFHDIVDFSGATVRGLTAKFA